MVKWNKCYSQSRSVKGEGPQGGTDGIVEYISPTNSNLNFLDNDEKFKLVDDASFLKTRPEAYIWPHTETLSQ